jgi:spore coat protein U-like protein
MKKIALIAAMSLMGMGSAMAQSTVAGNFNVTVTLTSQCLVTTVGTPALAFGTYTAFGAAVPATPIQIAYRCTRGLAGPTVAFDTAGGTSSATGTTASGEGVISGLRYTMAVAAAATGNDAGTAPVVASLGDIGTANLRNYEITGNMPANQAGTASVGLQTQGRTLILSY